jgi:hypothetical protein
MDQTLPPRLPANLETAVQRVRMAARSAAEHTVESLGLAALASSSAVQRDGLLTAQFELNRKLAIFALTFNDALDTDVARQAGTLRPTPPPGLTPDALVASWESLTLVDDHELEIHISADRFALEIAHACEWEIRELDAYIGTLLHLGAADHDRNPLRAEVVGQAMIRAIESVSDRPEVRKTLSTEIGRSLAHAMRQTYADIVADLRRAGVRPMGMAVRSSGSRSVSAQGALTGDSRHGGIPDSRSGATVGATIGATGRLQGRGAGMVERSGFAPSDRLPHGSSHGTGFGGGMGHSRVDAELTALLRRLAQAPADDDAFGDVDADADAPADDHHHWQRGDPPVGQALASNVIHVHREALREAASGTLDHMVIDVVAGLFDQILSDASVPPQMVRLIARLQLPVLRAALGDPSFFSSRRHPVRRFVNRIASLGTAVEDFGGDQGRALLHRVAVLVQEVVDGEFDQLAIYEQKLQLLEDFVAEQAQAEVHALGAADSVLARKETELRLRQRYAQELDKALCGLPVPDYLRSFLAETWSQAIASMAAEDGEDGERTERLRDAGRALVMSVQPKGTPTERHQFLRALPQLMKDLNTGLDRIRCPDAVRQAFFGQLLPAHAESLKGQSLSTLEHNLLVRNVETALATPLPRAADLPAVPQAAELAAMRQQAATAATVLTPAEARAVGLIDESAVDWSRAVAADAAAEAEVTARDIAIPGLPAPEPVEPMRGQSLADHVQIGFGYEMLLQGEWQRVRLAHVSAGRSFFVFTHGAKQRETVSMTYRMLHRLCAAGRLRALESAFLLERATARARRQLAALMPATAEGPVPPSRLASPVSTLQPPAPLAEADRTPAHLVRSEAAPPARPVPAQHPAAAAAASQALRSTPPQAARAPAQPPVAGPPATTTRRFLDGLFGRRS